MVPTSVETGFRLMEDRFALDDNGFESVLGFAFALLMPSDKAKAIKQNCSSVFKSLNNSYQISNKVSNSGANGGLK